MRKWSIILLVLIIIGVLGYNYVYQHHRDIKSETSVFKISSNNLIDEFQINPSASEIKYLDKTITVIGSITALEKQNILLGSSVFCLFTNKIDSNLKVLQTIEIKGRFIGYDDLLEQIKLDQCYIIN
jgi:hypothetical protein